MLTGRRRSISPLRIPPGLVAALAAGLVPLAVAMASVASAATLEVTSCDQVVLGGHLYPRYSVRVHNPDATEVACEVHLDHIGVGTTPDDTCSWVAGTALAGWQTVTFVPGKLIFVGCDAPIPPGGTLDGFQIVVTRACCIRVVLGNHDRTFFVDRACLDCAIPADASTWGLVKSRYR
jgi:hypothetical protein